MVVTTSCVRDPVAREAQAIFGHPVRLVDSAEAVSEDLARDLERRGLAQERREGGGIQLFFTDVSRFSDIARRFMGQDIPPPQHADI